jgi:hypothetical protein
MKHGAASMILVRQALGVLFIGSIWGIERYRVRDLVIRKGA